MKMTSPSNFLPRLAISLMPAVFGLWLPYLHLYLLNAGNLTLPFSVHVRQLGILSMVAIGLVLTLQLVAPPRMRSGVSRFFLCLGIFLWAEGTLFIGHFGFLQGGEMDWAHNRYLLYLELLLVGVLALLAFRLGERFIRKAWVIAFVLVISSLANIYPAFQADRARTRTQVKHTFTQEGVLQLSPDRNVLIFILDTFQSDVFAEIIAARPEWRDKLDGFTYFPNATSAFPKTYASVPNLLTGQTFDNSKLFSVFQRDAFLGNSAPKVLKDHGFDSRFQAFTWQPYFADPRVADNLSAIGSVAGRQWMQRHEFIQLSNLALFRLSPFLAKPWVYQDNEFRLKDSALPVSSAQEPYQLSEEQRVFSRGNTIKDLEALDEMLAFLSADGDKPTFRVFHFRGIHHPITLDRNLNFIGAQTIDRDSFREQAEGMVTMMDAIFGRLRETGTYDNSLIFVVGDHGCGEYVNVGFDGAVGRDLGLGQDITPPDDPRLERVLPGGVPLVLVKRIGRHGRMTIAGSPVELGDIPNTIFHELGFEKSASGPSMFDIPDSSDRQRLHKHYQFAGWGQDFIVPLTEYRISGFSWDAKSWAPTGRDLNQNAVESFAGRLVVLGQGGNMDEFPHEGWAAPEYQGRRLEGTSASISIPIEKDSGGMTFAIRMRPSQAPLEQELMDVFINDKLLDVWEIWQGGPITRRVFLPENVIGGRPTIDVRFALRDSSDVGPLIIEIGLEKAAPPKSYALGSTISFSSDGNARDYLDEGWSLSENWGTWTLNGRARMAMTLDSLPDNGLDVVMEFRPAVFSGSPPILVDVTANGEIVAHWILKKSGNQTGSFFVSRSWLNDSARLDLCFWIRNPAAPRDYMKVTDSRKLGLGVKSLALREAETIPVNANGPLH